MQEERQEQEREKVKAKAKVKAVFEHKDKAIPSTSGMGNKRFATTDICLEGMRRGKFLVFFFVFTWSLSMIQLQRS